MNIRNQNQGFTLVEILIAIVIIGILVSIASYSYLIYLSKHKINLAREEIRVIANYARDYKTHQNDYFITGSPPGSTKAIETFYNIKTPFSTDAFDYDMYRDANGAFIRATANANEQIFNVDPGDTLIYHLDSDTWTGTINLG